MSYDVTLTINTGHQYMDVYYVGNMTYNVAPMYKLALGIRFAELDGKQSADCIDMLEKAVAHMEANPGTYREMNPPNGWGDYETALAFFDEVRKACRNHPLTKISVS